MKPKQKLVLIISAILILDLNYGFDARFTIINLIWCVPIMNDWLDELTK